MKNFSAYTELKDSDVAWVNEIPNHWSLKKLKYIFRIEKRIAGELAFDVLSITQKGIKIKDIESGSGQLAMDYSKYQKIFKGEFAMNHMDLLTGYVDISKFDGVISPDYRVFRLIDTNCDEKFLLYLLQLCYHRKIFFAQGQGASQYGRWRMPADNFKNFKFPIPPKDEQKKIVSYLDFKIAKIENLIRKKKKLLSLYVERRKSLTRQMINSDSVEFVRLSSLVKLSQRPIERIDDKLYKKIGIFNRGRGIFHKEETLGKDLGDSNFHYIIDGDVILSGQFAWEGSIALASSKDAGCIASHRYPILSCNLDAITPEFLFSFFTISEGHILLDYHSRGAAGRNRPLNPRNLLKEKIPVPSITLQKELVEMIKSENHLKGLINKEIDIVKEYETALISEIVLGKIDVRNCKVQQAENDYESCEEIKDELSISDENAIEF